MLLASILAVGVTAASTVTAAPFLKRAALAPAESSTPLYIECRSPHTSYICPSDVRTLPAPSGYLACSLPESYSEDQICLYRSFANFELSNYLYDGSHSPEMGSDPACERWSRATTTCALKDQERAICQGEKTEYSCPTGYVSRPFLDAPTDWACTSGANTCFYYTDSGLLNVSDDGKLDTTGYRKEDFDKGCPSEMDRVTTCEKVIPGPWEGFSI